MRPQRGAYRNLPYVAALDPEEIEAASVTSTPSLRSAIPTESSASPAMAIRLVQIIPSLDRCGAEKQLTLLSTGLERSEFDVQVCVLTRSGPYAEVLQQHGIPLHFIDKRFKFDPLAMLRLTRLIKRLSPDIVQTWLFAANSYGRLAARWAGVPHTIASERCVDAWKVDHELIIDRWLARRSSRIVVNSPAVRDYYVERGIPAEKFRVIANAVEIPQEPAAGERERLCQSVGIPSQARLIGVLGRLWPQKRIKDAIWAADLLKVVRDDVHLIVLGDGPQRARLERFRDQVEIRDRVHLLGHRDDAIAWLPHLLCLWCTSEYEGQSNSVLEALAAGIPVVATDIPGNRDLVVDGHSGLLFPVGDRAKLARCTMQLLEDTNLARRLADAGRQHVASAFALPRMLSEYRDLYRQLMESSSQQP